MGSLPFLSGLTWAFSLIGQPVLRLQDEVVVPIIVKKVKKLNNRSIFFIGQSLVE